MKILSYILTATIAGSFGAFMMALLIGGKGEDDE